MAILLTGDKTDAYVACQSGKEAYRAVTIVVNAGCKNESLIKAQEKAVEAVKLCKENGLNSITSLF